MKENNNQRKTIMKKVALFLLFFVFLGQPIALAQSGSIYDYQTNRHYNYNIQNYGNSSTIYDYQRRTYIDGQHSGDSSTYYDYGSRSYSDVHRTAPGQFQRYDYGTNSYQDITVNPDGSADVYDYRSRKYYHYQLD